MNVIRTLMELSRLPVRLKRKAVGATRPTWSEEFELIATVLRAGAQVTTRMPVAFQRKVMEPVDRPPVHGSRLEWTQIGAARAAWVIPPAPTADSVVLYLHGGAYVTGSVKSHRDLLDRLVHATGGRALALEYRLAPEHPFPAAIEDALLAYRWLLAEGVPAEKIVIAGDSASGGLTLSTLFSLREAGSPLPAGAALISPWVDLDSSRPSMFENARWDYVTRPSLRDMARLFTTEENMQNPLAAPVYGRYEGLPPLLVHAGEVEGLRDDAVAVHEKATAAGVDSTLKIWPDMIHAFHVIAAICEPGRVAIAEIGEFVRARTS